ncbi:MAG TPA: pilus assembly protein [Beutenbergiaceae bacterium]|nr:pilus assembly protein [Beutenbergiaceae bacterium]
MRKAWRTCIRRVTQRCGGDDRGSAVVEFLGVSLVLLVPVIYLILVFSQVQAASFAAEGAARESGRLLAQARTLDEGVAAARYATELAFSDQGMSVRGAEALQVTCEADPCLSPGAYVHVTVRSEVPLPGMPSFLAGVVPAATQVEAEAMTAIPRYRETTP